MNLPLEAAAGIDYYCWCFFYKICIIPVAPRGSCTSHSFPLVVSAGDHNVQLPLGATRRIQTLEEKKKPSTIYAAAAAAPRGKMHDEH